jgi:hypothetical protein
LNPFSPACKAGGPVSQPLAMGRSKNVVSIAVNGDKKRTKAEEQRGKWSSDFASTRQLSFGLAKLRHLLMKSLSWLLTERC